MKVIAFILSAYFVFLLAIPCCSFDSCAGESTMQQTAHENEDPDCGSCSPFFTCTSCSGFTISGSINSEFIYLTPNNQYASYNVSSMPDMSYDFWQPPRLV